MGKAKVNYKIEPLSALNQLTDREKQVIEMRLGVGEYNQSHTLKEIGEIIGNLIYKGKCLNVERVRQIEAKALRKLRHPSRNCRVF
jgi:DNA-directed RNA polymerase sigma subunit (sigma70/sigma32)